MAKNITVGKKVYNLRRSAGFNQKQLADYLNIDQSYISKIEKDERKVTLDKLEQISDLFGYEVDYFTDGNAVYEPMHFELRADGITGEDLGSIAAIQKIAKNLVLMNKLTGVSNDRKV